MREGEVGAVVERHVVRRVAEAVGVVGGFEDLEDLVEEEVVAGLEPLLEGDDGVLGRDRCDGGGGGGEWE